MADVAKERFDELMGRVNDLLDPTDGIYARLHEIHLDNTLAIKELSNVVDKIELRLTEHKTYMERWEHSFSTYQKDVVEFREKLSNAYIDLETRHKLLNQCVEGLLEDRRDIRKFRSRVILLLIGGGIAAVSTIIEVFLSPLQYLLSLF